MCMNVIPHWTFLGLVLGLSRPPDIQFIMVSSKFTFFNQILKLNAQSGDLEMFLKSVDHANQPLAWKHCLEGNTAFRLLRKYYITNLSNSPNTKFILLWTRPELRSILQ